MASTGFRLRPLVFGPPGLEGEAPEPPEVADVAGRDGQRAHERGGADQGVLDPDRLTRRLGVDRTDSPP